MDLERAEARRKTSQQMDNMLEMFRWRFGEAEVGTPVLLAIPGVDKGCCMFPNLICVLLEKSTGGLYKLGSKTGRVCAAETSRGGEHGEGGAGEDCCQGESMGEGQGFIKCHCTAQENI